MKTHLDTGHFIIEEHTGDMYGNGLRFSLDERYRCEDGVTRLLNIGWYSSLDKALHAYGMAAQPTEEVIRDINTGPAA